jgi:hypothetical protein
MQTNEYQYNTFLTLVRTNQLAVSALKKEPKSTFVHLPMREVKSRFLPNGINDIRELVKRGKLELKEEQENGKTRYLYKCLEAGYYDVNLLNIRGRELNKTTRQLMNFLNDVELKQGSPSTDYFNSFLNGKHLLRRFFNVDEFAGRIHTPVTSLKGAIRENILLQGSETRSIDVVTMQPLLLGKVLHEQIGVNDYSNWINGGKDIYLMLKERAKLQSRDDAKTLFFQILFSKANSNLSNMFGGANWINWINEFKSKPHQFNPKSLEKNHSNLAWLLQNKEVEIMTKVWNELLYNDIPFLTVHDEIIVKLGQYHEAREIIKTVLNEHFEYFALSEKNVPPIDTSAVKIEGLGNKLPEGKKEKETLSDNLLSNSPNEHETKEPTPPIYTPTTSHTYTYTSEVKNKVCRNEFQTLKNYFNSITPPQTFDDISNVPKFINTHLNYIENMQLPSAQAYFDRLIELKNKLTK